MTAVCLEAGKQRVFATALDWPGWSRAARDETRALEALAAYAPRYAVVTKQAGVRFSPRLAAEFDVVERLPGSASTDYGVPGAIAAYDSKPMTQAEAKRLTSLVQASWTVFDRIVAAAPASLRKGPRGGGRDRDKMIDHVLMAEVAYASRLGLHSSPSRQTIIEALQAAAGPAQPVLKGRWPPRYAARRIAWHVLDHAWEIEDRTE